MAVAPTPEEIYERARHEGRRRLFLSPMDQVATSFIAGVTIIRHGLTTPGTHAGDGPPGIP